MPVGPSHYFWHSIRVSLISKSPRITTNRREFPRAAVRIAANSGANNYDALEMLVLSFARGHHMYYFLQVLRHSSTAVFVSIKHSISSTSCDVQLLNRSYGVHCSFRHARLRGRSWKCVAVLSRRYARGTI